MLMNAEKLSAALEAASASLTDGGGVEARLLTAQRALERIAGQVGGRLDAALQALGRAALEAADTLYRERIRTHPNDLRSYIGLGYKAQKADQWEEALSWFQQALRLNPRAPDVLSGLYQSYVRLGRIAEAENVIERWLQYNPEDASARTILDDLRRRREAGPQETAPSQ